MPAFLVALAVIKNAKGDRYHVQAIEVTIFAQGIMGRTEVCNVVPGEHIVQWHEQIGFDQAGSQFGASPSQYRRQADRIGTDNSLGGVGVKGNILRHDLHSLTLRFVELFDKGLPGQAAIAFKPP